MKKESIMCTNGSINDTHKPNVKCDKDDDKYCFDNSYKYCKELTKYQKIKLGLLLLGGIIILYFLNKILGTIPVLGALAVFAINLVTLAIIIGVMYMYYTNVKIKKTKK